VTAAAGGGWSVERRVDTARTLHASWPASTPRAGRIVAVCTVIGPDAVVLGSTQTEDVVALARAAQQGVDVVRRSSGGGAVWVSPGAQVWLDAWIPADDPLWDDDVIASAWWLGETWASALESLGAGPLVVHRGRARRTDWSDLVCFAGVGPAEVTTGNAKVVGIAQRRTREGARLHSMAMVSWDPAALLSLLSLSALETGPDDAARDVDALASAATGLDDIVPIQGCARTVSALVTTVEDALLLSLP
jgi:lipoate-protein ligase A